MLGLTVPCRHFFSCRAARASASRAPTDTACAGASGLVPQTILQRAAGRRSHVQRRPRRGAVPPRRFVR